MNENTEYVMPTNRSISQDNKEFWARVRRTFGVAIASGGLLSLISPLRTDAISFFPRLAYWEIIMISGASLSVGITEALGRWDSLCARPLISVLLTTLLISLPLTLIVIAASRIFFGIDTSGATNVFAFYAMTFAICLGVHTVVFLANRATGDLQPSGPLDSVPPAHGKSDLDEASSSSLFVRRLPEAYQRLAIHALQAEDHFLRVHFETGQSILLRARLSDATHELAGQDGAQTHRSWWVSRAAIARVSKGQGRIMLVVQNGLDVPVSRTFYRTLVGTDWFATIPTSKHDIEPTKADLGDSGQFS